jgi:hypothetical protein
MANPGPSEPTRMASARQLRTLNRLRARALGDLAIGIDASLSGEIDGPVCSVSIAGPRTSKLTLVAALPLNLLPTVSLRH